MSIDNIMNKSNQKESLCFSNDLNDKNNININIKNQSIIEINDIKSDRDMKAGKRLQVPVQAKDSNKIQVASR